MTRTCARESYKEIGTDRPCRPCSGLRQKYSHKARSDGKPGAQRTGPAGRAYSLAKIVQITKDHWRANPHQCRNGFPYINVREGGNITLKTARFSIWPTSSSIVFRTITYTPPFFSSMLPMRRYDCQIFYHELANGTGIENCQGHAISVISTEFTMSSALFLQLEVTFLHQGLVGFCDMRLCTNRFFRTESA